MLIYLLYAVLALIILIVNESMIKKAVSKIVREPRFSIVPHFGTKASSWGYSIYDNYESKLYKSNGIEFFSTSEEYVKRNVDTLNELNSGR